MNQPEFSLTVLLSALGLAIAGQLLHGHLGFNPTDEGFIHAISRSLLEGKAPHGDFISIRPVLSAVLHLPEVMLGGEYTFYLGRLVARLQFVVIVFTWIKLASKYSRISSDLKPPGLAAITVIVFILGTYYYNLTAWHTIDGIFLLSIGFLMIHSSKRWLLLSGFFVLGLACLAKQNFFPVPFLIWFLYRPLKDFIAFIFILLPSFLYIALLFYRGAWGHFVIQMTSETSLLQVGILSYISSPYFWGGLAAGGFSTFAVYKMRGFGRFRQLIFLLLCLFLFITLAIGKYEVKPAFILFGFLSGIILVQLNSFGLDQKIRMAIVAVALGWSASVSIGFNSPVFLNGIFMLMIWVLLNREELVSSSLYMNQLFIILALLALVVNHHANLNYIYRDRASVELNYPLSGILPGAGLLYTNATTFRFVSELDSLSKVYTGQGALYAVVPEFAAWWVQAEQVNPLSADWASGLELHNPKLLERVKDELSNLPPGSVVFAQKHRAATLALEPVPLKQITGVYPVVEWVESIFVKTDESDYWEIYTKEW